jgi:hypothetical protein
LSELNNSFNIKEIEAPPVFPECTSWSTIFLQESWSLLVPEVIQLIPGKSETNSGTAASGFPADKLSLL